MTGIEHTIEQLWQATFFYPISFSLPLLSKRGLACHPQMQYKQFPFAGCTIAFLGFTEEEEDHMKDIATKTGEWQWRRRVVLQYVGPCENKLFRTLTYCVSILATHT